MRTLKTLKPGLLFVRSLYDEETREHLKTVELVVQRRRRGREAGCAGAPKLGGQTAVAVRRRVARRIGWRERKLQGRVKSAGGGWGPVRRVWILRRDVAGRLDLLDRVVGGGWRCPDLETWCPDLETSGVSTSRHLVSKSRHKCPHLETT